MEHHIGSMFEPVWLQNIKVEPDDLPDSEEVKRTSIMEFSGINIEKSENEYLSETASDAGEETSKIDNQEYDEEINTEFEIDDNDVLNDSYGLASSIRTVNADGKHQQEINSSKKYNCEQCGKSFGYRGNFIRHIKSHAGEKLFKCDECSKGFSRASHLVEHKRIHTGEKPFKCNQCRKGFSQASHLVQHNRIHTGEQPFKCDQCSKGFSRASHLVQHKRIHTGEKPFICDQCHKGFSQISHLVRHKSIHTSEKSIKCD